MTVKECYSILHGDYEDVKERFTTDERIQKFLFLLLKDEHYDKLCEAMGEGNYEDAFLNVHTLKGMCTNLALTQLYEETKKLTDLLRDGECSEEAVESYGRVQETYTLTRKTIEELKNGK